MDLLDRLSLEHPVVQAGMGGGLSGARLAAAVSRAGGLGTVGILTDPAHLHQELVRARAQAPGRPVAANLLLPFARHAHAEACAAAGVQAAVLFCGSRPDLVGVLRAAGTLVLQQVGTVDQVRQALADGVDGLVAQGREAGGHLLGTRPALDFLVEALELADKRPVLLSGGIAEAEDVRRALEAGAAAAVAGTRFLLTDECAAHPAYKARVLGASRTIETRLFGLGWDERHRVVPNASTERWCQGDALGPALVLAANRLSAPLLRRLPARIALAALRRQSPRLPLLGPYALLDGMDERLVEATPLYAGQSAARIREVVPAARAVRELAGTLSPADAPSI